MKKLTAFSASRVLLHCGHVLALLGALLTPRLAAQSSVLGTFRADDLAFSQSPVNTPGPNRSPQPHGAAGSQGLLSATNYRLSYWSKTTEANVVRRWSMPLARESGVSPTLAFFRVNVTDARVLWEPVSRRFLVVAMQVAVLFGPHGMSGQSTPSVVLEWNGASWAARPPSTLNGPSVARADGAVYDPWKKECLVFSTNGTTGDIGAYYWNGRRFQRAVPLSGQNYYGTYFRGESIPGDSRFGGSLLLACDTHRRTLVHHGSVLGNPNVSLTAELRFVDRPEFFEPVPPILLTGANPTLVLSPLSTGASRYGLATPPVALSFQWFRNDVPLVDGGRISGATGPTLTITSMTGPDYGLYRLEVRDPAGHVITNEAQVGPSLTQGQVLAFAGRTPGLGFTIAWEAANLRLERSTTLQSWTLVPGAVSPFTIQISDSPSAFFRVVPGP